MSILRSCVALAAISLVAISARAEEVIPPKPAAYFNDYAGIVSSGAASRFNEQLAQFERETSNQVVVAIFPKMQSDDDVAAYTQRIAQNWEVGQKDKRNGVVLFIFTQDRKMFIQVGYGLEGALPDVTAFDIYENRIKPRFRSNDYEGGLAEGIDSIFKAIRGEYKGTGKTVRESGFPKKAGTIISFIFNHFFLFLFIILLFLPRLKPRKGYHYSSGGSGWGWAFSGGGGSGGGWSSGGGGGGGFSGFSGGGGSFGGGGAGGSW